MNLNVNNQCNFSQDLDQDFSHDIGAQVVPGIIIGSLETAQMLHIVNPHSVDIIINMSKARYVSTKPVLNIDLNDTAITTENIDIYIRQFEVGLRVMNNLKHKTILVHCMQGVNRSATLIGLYLVKSGMTYDMVHELLTNANNSRGKVVLTNPSFVRLLQNQYRQI